MEFVRSKYSSPWKGVVVDKVKRKGINTLLLVLVLKDGSGNALRKRILKTLDESWTRKVKAFDISHINQDWFKNIQNLKR